MIFYLRFLVAILVIVAFFYELCKVVTIHYAVAVNTNPPHHNHFAAADIPYITLIYSSERIFQRQPMRFNSRVKKINIIFFIVNLASRLT
jgi:hypothetical protein